MAELLEEHLDRLAITKPDDLVFPNQAGNPLAASSFLTHYFTRRAGWPRCRAVPRSVPHQCGAGHRRRRPPQGDPGSHGHASINVTLDRYGHLLPELDQAIAEAFSRELASARRRRENNVVHADFGRQ